MYKVNNLYFIYTYAYDYITRNNIYYYIVYNFHEHDVF